MGRRIEVELVADATQLQRAFATAARSATAFDKRLGAARTAGSALTRNITLPVVGIGVASLAMGAKFEDTMQKIVGLSGVSQKTVSRLRGEVLKLGPAVGKSPQELAEGLYFITSSGIPAAKAMDVLTVSAKASAAGLGETQIVADAVTSVMNAYGLKNMSAAKATDILVATVREGKGEASAFAGVIGNVTAIASQLGVSFNDVGAALAAQTRLGTDAETSATQLQRVFTTLLKVTPQSEKAFEKVGLSAAGLRKELKEKGLLATLETVKKAFAGNLPLLAKAFGDQRAIRGVLALVGNQSEATAAIFNRMKDSTGSLKTAFDAVSNDTLQKFNRMKASIQASMITLGAALAPVALRVGAAITRIVNAFNRLPHVVKFAFGGAVAALAIGGPLLVGFAALIRSIRTVQTLFRGVGPAAARGAAQAVVAEAAIGDGAVAAEGKVAALRGSLSGLGLAGGAIVAAMATVGIAEGYMLYKAYTADQGKKVGRTGSGTDIVLAANKTYYASGAPGRQGGRTPFTGTLPDGTVVVGGKVTHSAADDSNITGGRGQHGALLTNRHDRHRGPGATTPPKVRPPHGTSLQGRFNLADYQLAQAGVTQSQADDRRALETEAAITRQQIAQAKSLKDKTKYAQQLAGIMSQIQSIDAAAASDRKAAAEKRKADREKASQFSVPMSLQLAQAKADSIAAGTGATDLTKGQRHVLEQMRAAARRALKSHRLSIQGQIDAYNEITQISQQLVGQTKGAKASYHHASTKALTAGLHLTHDQAVAIRERAAQRDAHRGFVPSGPASLGQPITVHGGVHLHGVQNVDQLAAALKKKAKSTSQRRGTRR